MNARKKLLALLLVLALIPGFTACGEETTELAGTWETEIDVKEELAEAIDQRTCALLKAVGVTTSPPAAVDYFGSATLPLRLQLKEDGSLTFRLDETALASCQEQWGTEMGNYYRVVFFQLLADAAVRMGLALTVENPEQLEKVLGIGLEDAIAEALGLSLEDYIALTVQEIFYTGDGAVKSLEKEGSYDGKAGRLWFRGIHEDRENAAYDALRLQGDMLVISGPGAESGALKAFYPLIFRQAQ